MIKQVYIIPGSPPIVKIRPLRTKKMNVQNKVVLKGYVELATSSSTDVWWECIADEGNFLFFFYFHLPMVRINHPTWFPNILNF